MLIFWELSHFTAISGFELFRVRTGVLGAVCCDWGEGLGCGLAADAVSDVDQAAGKRHLADVVAGVSTLSHIQLLL